MEVHSGIIVALVASLALAGSMSGAGAEGTPVSGLRAVYRSGQVFLTWQEAETPAGTTFNVYVHSEPITPTNLARASKVGHHVERHSARDWWQDPASFDAKADPGTTTGFRIESGATSSSVDL